ncbi:MAG: hypothetical protein NBV67_00370 [Tagaea sp.]|nr:hypothetical protein [Tagaea sp.]
MPVEQTEDLAAMFDAAEFGVAATWKAGGAGAGVAVTLLDRLLGDPIDFGETRVRQDRRIFLARAAELPGAAKEDTIAVASIVYRVRDVRPDASGAVLTLDCAKV